MHRNTHTLGEQIAQLNRDITYTVCAEMPKRYHALGSFNLSDDPQSRKASYTELSFKRHSLTANIKSRVYILHSMSGGVAEALPIRLL